MGDLTDDGVIQIITMSAAQSLSVQMHPDEAYAQVHEDDHEKTESWYIVEAEPGATIILGSETDDIDALRAAAADDTIGDKYGRRVPVSEGSAELTCTRSLLMPASAGSYVVEGNCRVIRSYAARPGEVA